MNSYSESLSGRGRRASAMPAWSLTRRLPVTRQRNCREIKRTSGNLHYKLLGHGCASVAHCVTARWRNFSLYCRPLRQYDVWFAGFDNREALQPRRQQTVYTNKRLEFATEQVGRLRYVTAVDGRLTRFPSVAWFAHPCSRACREDWVDNVLNRNPCPETHRFRDAGTTSSN